MYNAAQILFALLGFAGVGWFVLAHLFSQNNQHTILARARRTALFLGLSCWLLLVLLRHDVVAATGFVIVMVLLWRFHRTMR